MAIVTTRSVFTVDGRGWVVIVFVTMIQRWNSCCCYCEIDIISIVGVGDYSYDPVSFYGWWEGLGCYCLGHQSSLVWSILTISFWKLLRSWWGQTMVLSNCWSHVSVVTFWRDQKGILELLTPPTPTNDWFWHSPIGSQIDSTLLVFVLCGPLLMYVNAISSCQS